MKIKKEAKEIWAEYERGRSSKQSVGLYENYKNNENFYIGKQWEGLNAPDLEKPVINVLKRVVSYFIAMIVTDDITVNFTPFERKDGQEMIARILAREVEKSWERGKMKEANRLSVRNAAVDGDACVHYYYDVDAEILRAEVVENIDVFFGNTQSADVQAQPYILFATYKPLDDAKELARKHGADPELLAPDNEQNIMGNNETDNDLVTILTKYWMEKGSVWCQVSAASVVIRKAWDTKYAMYPIAYFSWERVKNSCHGAAAVTGLIPNQVAINRLFSMAIHHIKTMAFPQVIFDQTKVMGNWKSGPGVAMGVIGSPNDAIATGFRVPDMSNQVLLTIDNLIERTMQFMGASDSALGTVRPDNTSAIIAAQKATAMPLEIQRMEYFRFVEDGVRIMVEMMRTDYGPRAVMVDARYVMSAEDIQALASAGIDVPSEIELNFDFGNLDAANMDMNVDIGSSAYWSELSQLQTMDNLFSKGIIQDAILYLEGIPDKYIRNKEKIIAALEARQAAARAQPAQPATPATPQIAPRPPEGVTPPAVF